MKLIRHREGNRYEGWKRKAPLMGYRKVQHEPAWFGLIGLGTVRVLVT